VAGTLVMASVISDLTPLQATVLSIVLGGTLSAGVHLIKAKARLLSTVTTVGIANPVLSTAEDAGAAVASIGALFLPLLVFFFIAGGIVAAVLLILRLRRHPGGQALHSDV